MFLSKEFILTDWKHSYFSVEDFIKSITEINNGGTACF
ncbi:hypothetical protein NT01EI_2396 [Edwardsiella ictaluri 93-146]|uniref:Uncharacterized protein n=1 Tax=Edwardsiella ictaluri (strain 93-146) TaxID=634503 RepID=C5BA86_EDWI9|nr:hypothetical protein NT01EI_2396 [Edwardsiella ictaluri 93-146]